MAINFTRREDCLSAQEEWRISTLQAYGQFLEEMTDDNRLNCIRLTSKARRYSLQFHSRRTMPATKSLHRQGNERDIDGATFIESTGHFSSMGGFKRQFMIRGAAIDEVLLQRRNDSDIEGSIATLIPWWKKDVHWTGVHARE